MKTLRKRERRLERIVYFPVLVGCRLYSCSCLLVDICRHMLSSLPWFAYPYTCPVPVPYTHLTLIYAYRQTRTLNLPHTHLQTRTYFDLPTRPTDTYRPVPSTHPCKHVQTRTLYTPHTHLHIDR